MFRCVLLFFCVLINIADLEEVDQKHFYIVSTTKSPYEGRNKDNFLKKQLEFCQKMEETNSRLSTVESQLLQTQKTLNEERYKSEELRLKVSKIETLLEIEQKHVLDLTKKVVLTEKISERHVASESQHIAKNCKEIKDQGHQKSDVYVIRPRSQSFKVFCDMETTGGGWTVFQRRVDGSEDFNVTWSTYKEGFGNQNREFWLGLEFLHQLTADGNNELYVELVDRNYKIAHARYNNFSIAGETEGYSLGRLSNYKGTAGDSLTYHNGHIFSTGDRDSTCATQYGGGWWFNNCLYSNLNGVFFISGNNSGRAKGINWYTFSTDNFSLLKSKMMTRPNKM